jgi:putative nucleotide binding protein
MMKEENCIVLDFLPHGYPDRRHAEPVAQAIGTSFFTLLEIIPREGVDLNQGDTVYIGEGKREQIRFIKGQIEFKDLTNMAQSFINEAVEEIVINNEEKFMLFFNTSGAITPRMHKFQLLPGIGSKHMMAILAERSKKKFESFDDIEKRVKLFPNPQKTVIRRILEELKENEKYSLFVAKPKKDRY